MAKLVNKAITKPERLTQQQRDEIEVVFMEHNRMVPPKETIKQLAIRIGANVDTVKNQFKYHRRLEPGQSRHKPSRDQFKHHRLSASYSPPMMSLASPIIPEMMAYEPVDDSCTPHDADLFSVYSFSEIPLVGSSAQQRVTQGDTQWGEMQEYINWDP
ncbi:hypothetical protein CTheo_7183 [Ceratobasidium theobromae]|uniref:Homeobox domain-containing protein n=1 Tax=Ceratobasidium theobromae TaxID=1582974 RepID=A0A5N5QCB2_9AGAM|nr:hypothetical protein CTheo_7183 [Ceratobasidium theobromae]